MDDDQDFLDLYREMLGQHLPSMPEVRVANSGTRALSILQSEQFNLLIADLNMPKMDGLQVLTIARRKFPHLRLVVLTGIRDEQFRTRAYALGVDQYWLKPETDQEVGLFMESMESLTLLTARATFILIFHPVQHTLLSIWSGRSRENGWSPTLRGSAISTV